MMLYLLEQYGSGTTDWEQPNGLYRSGSFLYLNNGKNNYNYYYEPSYTAEETSESTEESSSSSSSSSEENSEHTEPSAKENEQNR